MNYEELNMEYWGRVVPMVRDYNARHGTNLTPGECVWHATVGLTHKSHPSFDDSNPDVYKFAVAILEGKPLFIGDTVYHKQSGIERIINTSELSDDFEDNFTWQQPKPKRTFTLNGVELPCPIDGVGSYPMSVRGITFYFNSAEDRSATYNAIIDTLVEARGKQ